TPYAQDRPLLLVKKGNDPTTAAQSHFRSLRHPPTITPEKRHHRSRVSRELHGESKLRVAATPAQGSEGQTPKLEGAFDVRNRVQRGDPSACWSSTTITNPAQR